MTPFLSIICVSLLWGITNPLIKKGTTKIKNINSNSKLERIKLEILYLITNIGYLAPLGINQLGSLLYFLTLQSCNLSMVVPVTNSITFLVTMITSIFLGEKIPNKRALLGMIFILFGASCCYIDQKK